MPEIFPNVVRWLLSIVVLVACVSGQSAPSFAQKLPTQELLAQEPQAQANSCSALIQTLSDSIYQCSELNRNWVCYANGQAAVNRPTLRFYQPGDRLPVSVVDSVKGSNAAGIVLMNVVFATSYDALQVLLLGQVEIAKQTRSPEQLTLRVDNNTPLCAGTPPGILVRSESGNRGVVTINGVGLEVNNTIFVTMAADGTLLVLNVAGDATLVAGGNRVALASGYQAMVEIGAGAPRLKADPELSDLRNSSVYSWLAASGLPIVKNSNTINQQCVRNIQITDNFTGETLSSGQECLYRFCANAGDVVTVDMTSADSAINPWLDLRGPGGWLLAYNDDVNRQNNNSLLCNRVLPVDSCDYTVVARSADNASQGKFNLKLSRHTTCSAPELRCEVVSASGVTLRKGPNTDFAALNELAHGTQLHPIERTSAGDWALVEVGTTGQMGWVPDQDSQIACEDDSSLGQAAAPATLTPTPTNTTTPLPTPTATPTPTNTPSCFVKCFGSHPEP